jgi:enamine deaminase RidA (YjgF/YER057c/UK114 family)
MRVRQINAPDGPSASGGYSQAVEITGASRILYVSGQIPVDADGHTPATFEDQARLVWRNIVRQLSAANMGVEHIVKHTTFLSDRRHADANRRVRQEVLGERAPALTVIIADVFDDAWLLEIEAIAIA